ncbi:hypothetical protein [Streptomyces sp. NPDC051572]|uniref:helix-turn-helix transcriptional regulator n=1 Tax=Streptomyces sp. NPDC051572 TaxID=3155802 RepID=UPI00344BE98D
MTTKTRALTAQEARALPAMPTAQAAFAAIGVSNDLGYQLIRDGEFPVEVIKLGARALRVRRSDLLDFLGIPEENGDGAGAGTPTPLAERTTESTGK